MHRRAMMLSAMAAGAVLAGGASAGTSKPKLLSWADLVPEMPPIPNPFLKLSEAVREDLLLVERIRADLRFGLIDVGDDDHKTLAEAEARLTEAGIDRDVLEEQAREMEAEILRRGEAVNTGLNGRVVRLPGYVLPLEMSEDGVQEFLLVPYVGACIHTPPPPPNQIVFVELDTAYKTEALFEPVWVTGRMELERASRALYYIDGQADVSTGYTISGLIVEPYE